MQFAVLLRALCTAGVDFVVIGGVAAAAHGAGRVTQDLDVLYSRTPDNLERLAAALAPFQPYPRGAPPGLPFRFDAQTLRNGLNFTFDTTAGPIDILGEIAGGSYDTLAAHSGEIPAFGVSCRCLNLDQLIRVKRAAGRPKDFEALAELEALWSERDAAA